MNTKSTIQQTISTPQHTEKSSAPHLRVIENKDRTRSQSVQMRKRRHSDNPLRQTRISQGMTLDDLAEKSGLSPSYLSRLEGGSRRLNMDILQTLAQTLGCDEAILMPLTTLPEKIDYSKSVSTLQKRPVASAQKTQSMPSYALNPGVDDLFIFQESDRVTITRPTILNKNNQAFALSTRDERLDAFSTDSYIYIDPTARLAINDHVFVLLGQNQCFIGSLHSSTTEGTVAMFSFVLPNGTLKAVGRATIKSMFKVVAKDSL